MDDVEITVDSLRFEDFTIGFLKLSVIKAKRLGRTSPNFDKHPVKEE